MSFIFKKVGTVLGCILIGLTSQLTAQTVATVYSFDGSHGATPDLLTLTQGRGGRLYGTTTAGGAGGVGTIFKQLTATSGNLVLYNALGSAVGLTLAGDGNYYGTNQLAGISGKGTLFRVTSTGVLTVLHEFTGGSDAGYPYGPPIQALDGSLYGMTFADGKGLHSTLYRFTMTGVFSTIYTFSDPNDVPFFITQAADGNLYATGQVSAPECGGVFKLSVTGTLIFRHGFKCGGALGFFPDSTLVEASDGNLYGTNVSGGRNNGGTIYRMRPNGALALIYSFGASAGDGAHPASGLTQASDGNFYGSTAAGGSAGAGSLYELTLGGLYMQLYSFPKGGLASQAPEGSLTQSTDGVLYGTTYQGGTHDMGSIFKLDMGLGPFVALLRSQGKPGSTVGILGQGFTGTTAVTFNGVPTTFTVLEDTYMTAVVPSGAGTGPVLVTTPTGTLKSNKNFAQK
jgi:uncharacterized repeat protein (TIGR03803 family)